jgi:hypothetical protein
MSNCNKDNNQIATGWVLQLQLGRLISYNWNNKLVTHAITNCNRNTDWVTTEAIAINWYLQLQQGQEPNCNKCYYVYGHIATQKNTYAEHQQKQKSN